MLGVRSKFIVSLAPTGIGLLVVGLVLVALVALPDVAEAGRRVP